MGQYLNMRKYYATRTLSDLRQRRDMIINNLKNARLRPFWQEQRLSLSYVNAEIARRITQS